MLREIWKKHRFASLISGLFGGLICAIVIIIFRSLFSKKQRDFIQIFLGLILLVVGMYYSVTIRYILAGITELP